MSSKISDDDMAQAVAFIDGAMRSDERTRFELRLAAEPELASVVEALMRTDELVRRGAAPRAATGNVIVLSGHRQRSAWLWPLSLAAAVLVAFGIVRWIGQERSSRPERSPRIDCLVALAPSFASPEEFLASRPDLAGLKPPGLGSLRGPAEGTNIGAKEFVEKSRSLEERATAIAPSSAPITAGYFVIPIETKTSSSIVVLGFPEHGDSARLFPDAADARPTNELGRVEPGAHTLPRERLELVANGAMPSVQYNRGFLVPVGARAMNVLVGVRGEALDGELVAALDAELKNGDARDAVKSHLEEHGFHVTELCVIEPKD